MKPLDEMLIDPEPDALLAKLVKATRTANGRQPSGRIDKDADAWRRFLRRNRNQRQGVRRYATSELAGSPRVEVFWWSDHVGRKHWRIVGKRAEARDWQDSGPLSGEALWNIYPDGLALGQRGGGKELVAVCGCGAAGTLASLGWAGRGRRAGHATTGGWRGCRRWNADWVR